MFLKERIQKVFNKGAAHIFLGSFLTRFVSFFASIIVVRILSKTDYGILSYYENLYSYFFLFVGYGLTNAVLRYIVIADTINEKKSILNYCRNKGTKFNLFLVCIGIVFSIFYNHPDQFAEKKFFLVIMLLFLPFQYITNLYLINERAFFDNKRYAVVSFLYSFLLILFKLCGAQFWQLTGAVIFPLLIHFVFSIFLGCSDTNKYFNKIELVPIFEPKKKEIDKYSIQYMITNGLWVLFALNSTFIIGSTIGDADLVADYRIATVIPGLISILSTSLGIYVVPYFTKHEASGDYKWVRKNWLKIMLLSVVMIGLTVGILIFLAPFAIRLVFGDKYSSSFPVMRLLLIAAFFDAGIRYPTANLFAAMNKIKFNMVVSVIGIIIQMVLATILAKYYGIIGIAISNIIIQIIMSLMINIFFLVMFFSRKKKSL